MKKLFSCILFIVCSVVCWGQYTIVPGENSSNIDISDGSAFSECGGAYVFCVKTKDSNAMAGFRIKDSNGNYIYPSSSIPTNTWSYKFFYFSAIGWGLTPPKYWIKIEGDELILLNNEPECAPPEPEILTPYIKPNASSLKIKRKPDGEGSITIDPEIVNGDDFECDEDFSISLSNETDFELVGLTISLINSEVGDYTTDVSISKCDLDTTITIIGQCVEYPKSFPIKRITPKTCQRTIEVEVEVVDEETGETTTETQEQTEDYDCSIEETVYWTTSPEGDLNITLNSNDSYIFINEGEIECVNFTISTSSDNYSNCKFVNKGSIVSSESVNIGTTSNKVGGGITFDCNGVYATKNFNTYFRNQTPDLYGTFKVTDNFYIETAQGQFLHIAECANIIANNANINISGGYMQVYIEGHVIADYFESNNNVNVSGILTVGEENMHGHDLTAEPGSIINLCANPSLNSDDFGTCNSCNIFYNYGEFGWNQNNSPLTESDIAGEPNNKSAFEVYESYEDCIGEKNRILLGWDDDPFLPKDKEIKPGLNDCNACGKDFEEFRVMTEGVIYRIINQELIYCENDNINK